MYCFSLNQTKGSFRVNKLFFIFSSVLGTFILASIFLWDQQPEQEKVVANSKRFFISSQPNVRISTKNSKLTQTKTDRRTRTDAEIDSERRALRSKERFNLMEEEERGEFSDKTDCTIGIKFILKTFSKILNLIDIMFSQIMRTPIDYSRTTLVLLN